MTVTEEGAIMAATFVWAGIFLLGAIAVASAYVTSTTKIESTEEEDPA